MKGFLAGMLTTLLLGVTGQTLVSAGELTGNVTVDGTVFFRDALAEVQGNGSGSVAIEPEYYHEWSTGSSITVTPFFRQGGSEFSRNEFDVRELNVLLLGERWELRAGVSKVFWGVTEFVHLVDVINQTDLSHDVDGEEKLGQPMMFLSVPTDLVVVDLFVLPGFRERRFPERADRLRSRLVVDTDQAVYESSRGRNHVDIAVRFSRSVGPWDLGLYHFAGTGREPSFQLGQDGEGQPVLVPVYELIHQTGLDVQLLAGNWIWKLEAIRRTGQDRVFIAAVAGFEYTFYGVLGSRLDLGVVGEWAYDDRGKGATTPFQNDALLGLRLATNDAAGSELLVGVLQDAESDSRILQLEASRRIGDRWRVSLETRVFVAATEGDFLYDQRREGYSRVSARVYF